MVQFVGKETIYRSAVLNQFLHAEIQINDNAQDMCLKILNQFENFTPVWKI